MSVDTQHTLNGGDRQRVHHQSMPADLMSLAIKLLNKSINRTQLPQSLHHLNHRKIVFAADRLLSDRWSSAQSNRRQLRSDHFSVD